MGSTAAAMLSVNRIASDPTAIACQGLGLVRNLRGGFVGLLPRFLNMGFSRSNGCVLTTRK